MRDVMHYQLLSETRTRQAFEVDWSHMHEKGRLDALVPMPEDQDGIRRLLLEHYMLLTELFRSFAAQGATKPSVQSFELTVPLGEPAALFMRDALDGRTRKTLLVEGFAKGPTKPTGRAPFAIRLSDVRMTAVQVQMAYGEARVSLQAPKIEVFTAIQTSTGVMQPRQQFSWDSRAAGKAVDIPTTKAGK